MMSVGDININSTFAKVFENFGGQSNNEHYEDCGSDTSQGRQYVLDPITADESMILAQMYAESYEVFHNRTNKASKNGPSEKQILLETMVARLGQRGSVRTTKQVEQKIRDDLKRVKKFEAIRRVVHAKTGGGGKAVKFPKLSQAQQYLLEEFDKKPRIGGFSFGFETSSHEATMLQHKNLRSTFAPKKTHTSSPHLTTHSEQQDDDRKMVLESDREASIAAIKAYKTMQTFYEMAIETEKVKAKYYQLKLRRASLQSPVTDDTSEERTLPSANSKNCSRSTNQ